MNRILFFFSTTIFSVFLGSQITEGFLLVPYWKTLSTTEFYEYYSKFGPTIGKFYTILTIMATLVPICISVYCYFKDFNALRYSIVSTLFAFLSIALYYIYFRETNQQFFETAFNPHQLNSVLRTWEHCHWLRVFFEVISLIFLNISLNVSVQKQIPKEIY